MPRYYRIYTRSYFGNALRKSNEAEVNAEIETRFCTRKNTNTMHLVIVTPRGRIKVPSATVIVPIVVAVTTFLLMLY